MILTFEGLDVIESFSYYPPSNILPLTASDSLNLLTEEKIFFKRGICITGLSVLWRLLINVLKLYSFSCFILLVANIIRIVFRMPSKSDKFRGDFLTPVQLLHNSKSLINVVYFELTHPTYFFTRLLTSVISLFIKPAQIIIGCYYFIHYYNLFYAKIALKETIVFGEIRNGSIFYVCFVLVPKAGAFHRVYRLFRLRMGRKEDRFTWKGLFLSLYSRVFVLFMLHPETAYTIINLSVTAHNVIFAQSSLSWGQITRARGFKKIKLFFLMLSGELSYTLRHASSYVNKASKERVYFVHDQIFFNPRPSNTLKFRVTLNELQQMEPQGGNDPSASIYTLQDHKRGIFVGHHGMAVSKGALQSTFRDNLVISHSTLPGQKSIILGTDNRNYKTHLIYNDLQNFDICKLGDRNFAIYNGIQIFNNFETVCTKGFCMRFLPTHLHVQDTKRSLISGHSIYEGVIGGNYYSQIVPFYHSMGLISEREKRLFEIYAEISHTVNSLQLTQDPNMLDPSSITFSFMHKKRFEIDKAVRELEDPFSRIFSFRKNDWNM